MQRALGCRSVGAASAAPGAAHAAWSIAHPPSPTTAAACIVPQVHGRIRRYTSPDEHAFFAEELPSLVLPPITYEQVGGVPSWSRAMCLIPAACVIRMLWILLLLPLLAPDLLTPSQSKTHGTPRSRRSCALPPASCILCAPPAGRCCPPLLCAL